jgi:hypothetical protein
MGYNNHPVYYQNLVTYFSIDISIIRTNKCITERILAKLFNKNSCKLFLY